jgi:hypothetical protein
MSKIRLISLMLALGVPLTGFAADPTLSREQVPSLGENCANNPPSFGLVRQTISLDPPGPFVDGYVYADAFEGGAPLTQWADLFGTQFPTRSGNAQVTIEHGKFVALAFETGALGDPIYGGMDYGMIRVFAAAAYTGNLAMAFSECPGDFLNPVQANSFCRLQTGQGAFSWQLAGTEPFICQLAENTTYYFNLAYVDMSTGQPNCAGMPDGSCNAFLEPR